MKRLGSSIWWSVADQAVLTADVMTAAGFTRLPRNDAKTSLIKACKVVKKDWVITDAMVAATAATPRGAMKGDHRRYHDDATECRIALTHPRITASGYATETGLVVTLSKNSKSLSFERGSLDPTEADSMAARLREEFEKASTTIDATQLRLLIAAYVKDKCHAVSMRAFSGGVYFVPLKHVDAIDAVKRLCANDPKHMVFDTHSIYDDGSESSDRVSHHATVAFEKEIASFIAELQKDVGKGMSKAALERRVETATALETDIKTYGDHLRAKADEFLSRTTRVMSLLEVRIADAKGKTVEPFDLMGELAAIDLAITLGRRS